MTPETLLAHEISRQADEFYPEAERFGAWMAAADGMRRAQVSQLEAIVNSALKVADVLDFLKRQTGRAKPRTTWRSSSPEPVGGTGAAAERPAEAQILGAALIEYIQKRLVTSRDKVLQAIKEQGHEVRPERAQEVYLALIRAFVAQAAAHYTFKAGGNSGADAQ
ncbi:MAG: hypothetical protein GX774_17625 [Armatimonadetes bacterium]|nr:hypothetical protein [Armatimonadota bacterium]